MREFKDAILRAVEENQVVLVAGSTGCGKTTQVPQYVLDDAWAQGRGASIVCTQPRRISAMTVSERIANERGESVGQSTVGYQIRLENRVSRIVRCCFARRASCCVDSRAKRQTSCANRSHTSSSMNYTRGICLRTF